MVNVEFKEVPESAVKLIRQEVKKLITRFLTPKAVPDNTKLQAFLDANKYN